MGGHRANVVLVQGLCQRAERHAFRLNILHLHNAADIGCEKTSLREVVEYFNNAIPENPEVPASQISGFFRPLGLTEAEIDDLVEFLENGLFDPNLQRYAPTSTASGNCFPNNDALSQIEMGCN